ncbi:hypothetical protein D9611_008185 [Ephemerocybe angulata]|uniref:CENP-V/GFA domain-containing protein n=1 Tax=Ephemerocybe angulata TaxID=980116 RepID=A0A8H5FCS4_9AGAR|nr:hypothetical protein D9611_008185 [Tulosesus angulatus]
MPYHGNCLCGAVAFEIEGEPFHFAICHCQNCKQASGGAFMVNSFFKPSQVKISKGGENLTTYKDGATKSGNAIKRSFCSVCGSNLFIEPVAGNITIVQAANVKGSENWVPKKEFFGEGKWKWVKELEFRPKNKAKL